MDVDVKNAYDDVITVCGVEIINKFAKIVKYIYFIKNEKHQFHFNPTN